MSINCPRCNALARHKFVQQDKNVIIVLECDKCKLTRNVGITTQKALKLRRRRTRLKNLLNQERNQLVRGRLEKTISALDEKIRKSELGI